MGLDHKWIFITVTSLLLITGLKKSGIKGEICSPECLNGGSCVSQQGGGPRCNCVQGFSGTACDTKYTNSCHSNPCLFEGTCHLQLNGGYTCTCAEGYLGYNCEAVIRHCSHEPCGNHGICVDNPEGGYKCYCKPGYHGNHCQEEIDECAPSPCRNGGVCLNLINGFKCTCTAGYTGAVCDIDINECESSPCQHGGSCDDSVLDSFRCRCVAGYTGVYCELNVDECSPFSCVQPFVCVDLVNQYRCECPRGLTGERCESQLLSCHDNLCLHGGTCINNNPGYTCSCSTSYTGPHCETLTEFCIPNPCLHGATCVNNENTPENFTCECVPGFIGQLCEGDVYECNSQPCRHGGTCIENTNGVTGYTCVCAPGYTGDECTDVFIPCYLACLNGGFCHVQQQGETCICPSGWEGMFCEQNINECAAGGNLCENSGYCVDLPGTFLCSCNEFWEGSHCETDVLECASQPCPVMSVCEEKAGAAPVCTCLPGRTGSSCETEVDFCSHELCQNSGKCTSNHENYTCHCADGFTGFHCETDINECDSYLPCLNNATCTDEVNGYTCTCLPGYTGVNCTLNIDECGPDPCYNGGSCMDGINEFICQCSTGYTGFDCSTKIQFCDTEPCMNNATCAESIISNFTCTCPPGFIGPICEVDVNECKNFPCLNNGTCNDEINGYTCICTTGYNGENCSEDINECASLPCQHGGTCSEPHPGSYHCSCPIGMSETNCSFVSLANFNGETSFNILPTATLATQMNMFSFKISFMTSVTSGILFVIQQYVNRTNGINDIIYAELSGAQLHFTIIQSDTTRKVNIYITNQSNKVYQHTIQVTLGSKITNITLDPEVCNFGTMCHASIISTGLGWKEINNISVGGNPTLTPYLRSKITTTKKFIGCLGNIFLGNQNLNLAPLIVNQTSVRPGCVSQDRCYHGYCNNGGTCVDMWLSRHCQCPIGYIGDKCQNQNVAQFLPMSMLHFTGIEDIAILSFWVSSKSESGVIAYTVGFESLSLSLELGQLRLLLLLGEHEYTNQVGSLLNDGKWFLVQLHLGQGSYRLEVYNTTSSKTAVASGTVANFLNIQLPLFVGQLHPHPAVDQWRNAKSTFHKDDSFEGCLQNLTINGELINLESHVPSVFGNDPSVPSPGCHRDEACVLSPCQNNVICLGGWEGYKCECSTTFEGNNCTDVAAYAYNGIESYTYLQLDRRLFPFGEEGTLNFRTRQKTATLLYLELYKGQTTPDYIEFKLYNNQLQIVTRFNENVAVDSFIRMVSDAEWHSIHWRREGHDLLVALDTWSKVINATFEPYHKLYEDYFNVYIGAKPLRHGSNFYIGYFEGCLNNLSFNKNLVKFMEGKSISDGLVIFQNRQISTGCIGKDVCDLNPCPTNALCQDHWNAFSCPCEEGWEDTDCTKSTDDCASHQCHNGARCVDGHTNYTCDCVKGYTGKFCEDVINLCDQDPCVGVNTVQCLDLFPLNYSCECVPGFTGVNCSVQVNMCNSNPCQQNATCVNSINNYNCICDDKHFGDKCQHQYICSSNPCFNDGTCSPKSNNLDYDCSCLPSYYGNRCQSFNFCMNHDCQNNATCVLSNQSYSCHCDSKFYGALCQLENFCHDTLCQNNGECINDFNKFICRCPSHYEGPFCEVIVNKCKNNQCLNGGSCFHDNNTLMFTCECVTGFTGILCETDINECLSSPCFNGGQCIEISGDFLPRYRCICPQSHFGNHCQNETNKIQNLLVVNSAQTEDDNTAGVAAASSIIIFILVISIAIYLCWYWKKSVKMHGRYKPADDSVLNANFPLDKMLDLKNGERLI